ncbi:hypothetical protein L4174_006105 [Photobacterium sp. CCB-ST2H9]|uniref:hypothetical protein n=1 Tax=Photobacterium sp. CCB-ST2H9 TaxID=2912855 RepID=UPI0020058059|nr:hypothetical protein [Photobacterium sp. CCB-ST2H9]UTM58408.1 hypothetical protein L4174_006105 [Photobacterium sp. CCB-ST2H9]
MNIRAVCFLLMTGWMAFPANAQQEITLEFSYMENTVFTIQDELKSQMYMNYQGNNGQMPPQLVGKMPSIADSRVEKLQKFTTGKVAEDGSYPVEMAILKNRQFVSMNQAEMKEVPQNENSMEGVIFSGRRTKDGKFIYEGTRGKPISAEQKEIIKTVFSQLGSLNELNGKKMKVGDTVSMDVPTALPFGQGRNATMNTKTLFTLNRIEEDLAFFDVRYQIEVSTDAGKGLSASGGGDGSIIYHTKLHYMSKMDTRMVMEMFISMGEGRMAIKSTTENHTVTTLN